MADPDDNGLEAALDESHRRYYLDTMGIQCWQLLESQSASLPAPEVASEIPNTQQHEILARGSESADMMFVLLSPNSGDEASGELCSGEEGALLTKMLAAINVSIADVYITSLFKSSASVGGANLSMSSNEIEPCYAYLKQQMQKVKPRVLIALGESAGQYLSKQNMPLDTLREEINQTNKKGNQSAAYFESVPLFVSYSPAELLQQAENKRKAWLDLQQLQERIQE